MTRRNVSIAAVLVVVAAAAFWWWTDPQRQIRAILDDVAAAFTRDGKESGLESLAAVAALRAHLAPDVVIELPDSARVEGQEEAITAAARVRAGSERLRVRFFNPEMTFSAETSATVTANLEVAAGAESGEDSIDVQRVTATLHRIANRWVVSTARIAPQGTPLRRSDRPGSENEW